MVRVKRGVVSRRKHKKILKLAKGYRMTRSRLIKRAKEAVLRAGEHAFAGRKNRKRDFRRLWITRISEAVKKEGISYSRFIHALKEKNIELDRKILADLVVNEPEVFKKIIAKAKG
jgi:large subunit ribosomal protein L20